MEYCITLNAMFWQSDCGMIELVLGGTRSGKSRYAEQQAKISNQPVIYIATAEARDKEMTERIARHREDRPQHWQTTEEPIQLGATISRLSKQDNCLLVDCLTLWLSNILFDYDGQLQYSVFEQEKKALLSALTNCSGRLIMVSNEVGQSVVAIDKMTRLFIDEAGRLHQDIAAVSDKVVFVTAGLPATLKP
jgi:adenosylcobinamide kinase / adenosylcobinamide-phosphate guanylyltransferase